MKHPFIKIFHPWLWYRLNRIPAKENNLYWELFYVENNIRHEWLQTYKKKVTKIEQELGHLGSIRSINKILRLSKRAILNRNMPKKINNLMNRISSLEGTINKIIQKEPDHRLNEDIRIGALMRLKKEPTKEELRLIDKETFAKKELAEQKVIKEICHWHKEKLNRIKDILKPHSA